MIDGDLQRPEIASSWARTRASGLTTDTRIDPGRAEPVDRSSRLRRAAEPVLAELAESLQGSGYALLLADHDARLVDIRFGNPAMRPAFAEVGAVVGQTFSEPVTGTNSIATALEVRHGISVHGAEHYLESFRRFACYGLPITDPATRRSAGVLDITCLEEDATPLLRPFLLRGVRDIEARLLGDTRRAHRSLLDAFDAAVPGGALVALGPDLVLANPAAAELLEPADHATLQTVAAELRRTRDTTWRCTVDLTSGERVGLEARTVDGGVLLRLRTPRREPVPRGRPVAPPDWFGPLRTAIDRYRADGTSVLVRGEAGTGRRTVARMLLGSSAPVGPGSAPRVGAASTAGSASAVLLDGPSTHVRDVRALDRGTRTIVVTNADLLPADAAALLDRRIGELGLRVLLTTTGALHGHPAAVGARCPVQLDLPTLRSRRDRIPMLAAALLQARAGALRFTPQALRTLAAQEWPGNLRELASVIEHVAERRSAGDVTEADLPPGYRDDRAPVTGALWQAERDAIVDALRRCAGNKVHAAEALGISRTTLYRQIRRLRIEV